MIRGADDKTPASVPGVPWWPGNELKQSVGALYWAIKRGPAAMG